MNKQREKYIKLRCIEKKIEPIENNSNSYCMFIPAKDLSRVYKMKHNYVQNAKRVTIIRLSAGNNKKKAIKQLTAQKSRVVCYSIFCAFSTHFRSIRIMHPDSRLDIASILRLNCWYFIKSLAQNEKLPHFHNEIWFLLC